MAAEILGNLSVPKATQAMVKGLEDEDPSVRSALLRALSSSSTTSALLEIAVLLDDPEPEVPQEAITALTRLSPFPRGITHYLEPLLDDPVVSVRCQAAAALLDIGDHPRALFILIQLASEQDTGRGSEKLSDRIMAIEALSLNGGEKAFQVASKGLSDPTPAIRWASVGLIAWLDSELCLYPLKEVLGDEDPYVRQSAAEALGRIGEPALPVMVEVLGKPKLEECALQAMSYLSASKESAALKSYSQDQAGQTRYYHELWLDCRRFFDTFAQLKDDTDTLGNKPAFLAGQLLADSLQSRARSHGTNTLKAMGVLQDRDAVLLAVENLDGQNARQRANAIETLESVGDPSIVRQILPLWKSSGPRSSVADEDWLKRILTDHDNWLRAIGAYSAQAFLSSGSSSMASASTGFNFEDIRVRLVELAAADPALVRESAQPGSRGDLMDTSQTLSTMERILFLRQIPLFAPLPPNDLKQIAAVTAEKAFIDGAVIVEQGDEGDVLYVIVGGEVTVTTTNAQGEQSILGRRKAGEYFGEMAIISNEVCMARLTALGDVRTLCISQKRL